MKFFVHKFKIYTHRFTAFSYKCKYSGEYFQTYIWHIQSLYNYLMYILIRNFCLFYRYSCSENRQAYRTMASKYDADIVGQVMEGIVEFHKLQEVLYTLDEEAESIFEVITDKLNDQLNLKYTSASQISASQPDLDNTEKSELSVRTKATEIIGRLTCVLWVYCKGSILYQVLEVLILNNYETYKYILHLLNSLPMHTTWEATEYSKRNYS